MAGRNNFSKKSLNLPIAVTVTIFAFLLLSGCTGTSKSGKHLEAGFINPPDSARPRVWWHWMNGNITKKGIHEDLEWMHRVGIAGFQNFDAALNTPQIVEKRLVYMTPDWKDAFRFTTLLADSLKLEMAIAGSPGWSESGGPWVKPEEAMKKFTWSEIKIEGGKTFNGILPHPPSTTGSFQNIPMRQGPSPSGDGEQAGPEFYADAAVVACRLPDTDLSLSALNPKITSSGGKFALDALTDGDLVTSSLLPYTKPGENAWIMFEFDKPENIEALSVVGSGSSGQRGFGGDQGSRTLEASDDGRTFSKVTDIPDGRVPEKTLSFAPVIAKYFRFTWRTPMPRPPQDQGGAFGPRPVQANAGPQGVNIAELVLYPVARINRFEDKAAFATATDLYTAETPAVNSEEAIKPDDVIDLTGMMKSDGSLEWTAPEGNWLIIRLGYTLTGHRNSPASPEATGLEVDKLSAVHVRDYFNNYLDQYEDATGGLMGKRGLQYMITDSWEAGTQNWTENLIEDFKNHRGYDMVPWIPALTGHIVQSSASSDRFLWDFRRTLSDLVAENHYDQLTEILKERGMGRYTESHESGRAFIGDGMEVKRKATVPMSATWTPGGFDPGLEVAPRYKADVRESASVAHIYGQNTVAAESMTARGTAWAWAPETLKPTADMEMANGLNRFVIHTSVHQPVDDKIPGLGLGPFGQWFTRHETWAEQAGPWIKYLGRSCFMLQQGNFVADIVYYYGEDNNITALFGQNLPDIPEGYNYDFVNADALVNVLSVENGMINTPGGTVYRLMALDPNSRYMTLPVLKKIRDMVNAGAVVVGNKPLETPSLTDDPADFNTIVNELWANAEGENIVGKGKVLGGTSLKDALDGMNISPDFTYTKPNEETRLLFVHRHLKDADIYWVNSRNSFAEKLDATFRVTGKSAEIWDPVTGLIEEASFSTEDGHTTVPLNLESNDALFVVFRKKTGEKSRTVPEPKEQQLALIEGPWEVSFQENRGAPARTTFETLTEWNENTDPGIKYFSGAGTYSKKYDADQSWFSEGSQQWLDLGIVKNLAEVTVNGEPAGIVWKTPFRVNVTGLLKPGENEIGIKVTNLWVNRLIGDEQPGVENRITYTTMQFYRADSPLKPSGLLGPVKIIQVVNN